jgi:hypothetical protein
VTVGPDKLLKSDPRATIAEALMAYLTPEQCQYLIDDVLSIDKVVPVEVVCDNCGHTLKRRVSVPDSKAVVSALTDLLAQGFGRPREAKVNEATIVFKRLVRLEDD